MLAPERTPGQLGGTAYFGPKQQKSSSSSDQSVTDNRIGAADNAVVTTFDANNGSNITVQQLDGELTAKLIDGTTALGSQAFQAGQNIVAAALNNGANVGNALAAVGQQQTNLVDSTLARLTNLAETKATDGANNIQKTLIYVVGGVALVVGLSAMRRK